MTAAIDSLLAEALRGETAPWPRAWTGSTAVDEVRRRIAYHGIAGLIAARATALADWPAAVREAARKEAIARSMWELQHRPLLAALLDGLAEASVAAVLLKGSALAYDLYPVAATRARGDSDLLIAPADLDRAREVLTERGFSPPDAANRAGPFALQEGWGLISANGMDHQIDLHWQVLNAPALGAVMPVAESLRAPLALPRLGSSAHAMRHAMTLLHSCVHRAMHLTSPYFVDGETHYGGDRLIWAVDIDLLARALRQDEWRDLAATARRYGVARACLAGLDLAQRWLGTGVPVAVRAALAAPSDERASSYLLDDSQFGRARRDLSAIPGARRKFAYLTERTLPNRAFIRAKYPRMARYPAVIGYARRVIDLLRPRRSSIDQ